MSNALSRRRSTGRHLAVLQDPPADSALGAEDPSARADAANQGEADADATAAVVAHGLLGNLAVVRGVARVLISDPDIPEPDRSNLLEMLDSQVNLMHGILTDLIRVLPSQALAALDDLRR